MIGVPRNIQGAIENLVENDVKYRLDPDTKIMEFVNNGLPEWLVEHLKYCRREYTAAVRFEAGLCVVCGADSPKHPAKNQKWLPLWCTTCYDRGAWEARILGTPMKKGPKANASSKAQRSADDALFAGIGDDESDPLPVSLFDGQPE